MKYQYKILLLGLILFISINLSAQFEGFNYQGVARDNNGAVLQNQSITLQFSIIDGAIGGISDYTERHNLTTNQFGLFTATIGQGIVQNGSFSNIDWAANTKFLKVEMDATGGISFLDMGTTQLLTVPYAMFAKKSYEAGDGLELNGNILDAKTDDALWNAKKIQGKTVDSTAPTDGEVLQYDASTNKWKPTDIMVEIENKLKKIKTLIYTTDGF